MKTSYFSRLTCLALVAVFLIGSLVPVAAQEPTPAPLGEQARHNIFLPAIAGSADSPNTQDNGWTIYSDPRYGYQMIVPAQWDISPTSLAGYSSMASIANYDASGLTGHEPLSSGAVKIDIGSYSVPAATRTEEWIQAYAENPTSATPGPHISPVSESVEAPTSASFAPQPDFAQKMGDGFSDDVLRSGDIFEEGADPSIAVWDEEMPEAIGEEDGYSQIIAELSTSIENEDDSTFSLISTEVGRIGERNVIHARLSNSRGDQLSLFASRLSTTQLVVVGVLHDVIWPEQDIQAMVNSLAPSSAAPPAYPDHGPTPLVVFAATDVTTRAASVIHPPDYGSEVGGSPLLLHLPFQPGTEWKVGGSGSYYSDGYHNTHNNDYYATDWNRGSGNQDEGEPVYPVADGVVTFAGESKSGFGKMVEVLHYANGTYIKTRYAHLKDINVAVQKVVGYSSRIGSVGRTGNAKSAHLHFSIFIRKDDQWISKQGMGVRPSPILTDSGFQNLRDGGVYRVSSKPETKCTFGPIYSYWNGRNGDSFYTANLGELGVYKYGYRLNGVLGLAFTGSCATRPTTPLLRYWNGGSGDHHYTTNPAELGQAAHGYVYEGIAAYLPWKSSYPVYRYWNPSRTDHRLSRSSSGAGNGWKYEGRAGYLLGIEK